MRWTVLLPFKSLAGAKARLVDASPDAPAHRRLVQAIRADTLAAAGEAACVSRVVVVTDAPAAGEFVFVQVAPGLNAGLAEAARDAFSRWPDDAVAALVGDLPALRHGDLDAALALAAAHPRSFVRDADGSGTTLLAALPGTELRPAFGPASASRHAMIAAEIEAAPSLRRDVDTARDLDAARTLGLGPRTRALYRARSLPSRKAEGADR